MRKIVINGGKPLKGEVAISGAKNSVVALIPAAILSDDIVILDGVPEQSQHPHRDANATKYLLVLQYDFQSLLPPITS